MEGCTVHEGGPNYQVSEQLTMINTGVLAGAKATTGFRESSSFDAWAVEQVQN